MAEVRLTQGLWKVTLTEYERGYGQRVIWVRYFDNEAEARSVAEKSHDWSDPDDYYRAEVSRC
jgi:uncharacterized membrane protein YiaA